MKKCLLFSILLLLSGCLKKEKVAGTINGQVENAPAPSVVVMGDSSSCVLTRPGKTVVDLDGDHINDIEVLHNEVRVSHGGGYQQEYRLHCIQNTVSLSGDSAIIPLWLKEKDTVYVAQGVISARFNYTTDCNAAPGASVLPSYRLAKAVRLDAGATVSYTDHFMTATFDLNKVVTDMDFAGEPIGDTSCTYVYYTNYCHNLIHTGENYFCFRIQSNGHYRYGWLMLRSTDMSLIEKVGLEK